MPLVAVGILLLTAAVLVALWLWVNGQPWTDPEKRTLAQLDVVKVASGETSLFGAEFSWPSSFVGASFEGTTIFEDVTFGDDAWFEKTSFGQFVSFQGASFEDASFNEAVFAGNADF